MTFMRSNPSLRSILLVLAVVAALVVLTAFAGCSSSKPKAAFSGAAITPAVQPKAIDLSTPDKAVATYLEYVSYAYRKANSDVASTAIGPDEVVRVDSYIEYNREKDRGLEQMLTKFTKLSESRVSTQQVITAREDWRYRYFALSTAAYVTPMYTASYDTTYTVVRAITGWQVDKVEAKPLTPVQ
jgi:hypothetical protein